MRMSPIAVLPGKYLYTRGACHSHYIVGQGSRIVDMSHNIGGVLTVISTGIISMSASDGDMVLSNALVVTSASSGDNDQGKR